jgi:hypothetical protein
MAEPYRSIKITSDGTSGNTKVTLPDGTTIGTISKITFQICADQAFGKAIIECLVPAVELELPPEDVEFKVASIKRCDKCGGITKPEVLKRDDSKIVRYTCVEKDCRHQMEYPFDTDDTDWNKEEHPQFDMEALGRSIEEAGTDGGK